jgi:hypothetical protein
MDWKKQKALSSLYEDPAPTVKKKTSALLAPCPHRRCRLRGGTWQIVLVKAISTAGVSKLMQMIHPYVKN